jgi:hypothetical protein
MYKTYRFVRPESIKISHNPEVTKLEFEEFTTDNLDLQRAIESGKITTINKAQLFDRYIPEERHSGFVVQEGYGLDLIENEHARNQKSEPRYFVCQGEKFYPLVKKPQKLQGFETKFYGKINCHVIVKVYNSSFNFDFDTLKQHVVIDETLKPVEISEVLGRRNKLEKENISTRKTQFSKAEVKQKDAKGNLVTASTYTTAIESDNIKKLIKFVNTELDSFNIWDYEEKLDKLSDEELDVFIEELSNVLV